MANVVDMDEQHREKLAKVVADHAETIKARRKATHEQEKALKSQLDAARDANDKDKMAEVKNQMAELRKGQEALNDQRDKAIDEIMTEEQKQTWADFQVARQVARSLRKVKLTEEQTASLQKLCQGAGSELAAAEDRKASKAVIDSYRDKAIAEILTDEQKEQLQPKQRQGKEKAGSPKAKAAKKDKPSDDATEAVDGDDADDAEMDEE
jgi:hypothetical protein